MLYLGRYIIMMMGIFSSYAGFLYNDIYSKGFDIFTTSWTLPKNDVKKYEVMHHSSLDYFTKFLSKWFHTPCRICICIQYTLYTILNTYRYFIGHPKRMKSCIQLTHISFSYSSSDYVTLDPKYDYTQPYFYGIDPFWIIAENELTFFNSYKMKLSVILGLCQMTFGLCLSCVNYR